MKQASFKQKDIAMIVIVAFFAGAFSLVLTNLLFVGKTGKDLKAETVSAITSEFQKPDDRVFNSNAINPTKLIQIGENNNQKPF